MMFFFSLSTDTLHTCGRHWVHYLTLCSIQLGICSYHSYIGIKTFSRTYYLLYRCYAYMLLTFSVVFISGLVHTIITSGTSSPSVRTCIPCVPTTRAFLVYQKHMHPLCTKNTCIPCVPTTHAFLAYQKHMTTMITTIFDSCMKGQCFQGASTNLFEKASNTVHEIAFPNILVTSVQFVMPCTTKTCPTLEKSWRLI